MKDVSFAFDCIIANQRGMFLLLYCIVMDVFLFSCAAGDNKYYCEHCCRYVRAIK